MHFRRHTITFLLLSALTLGGVVSPLAHLSYMALSAAYAPFPSHAEHGQAAEHHAAALPSDGPAWQAPHDGHAACPYLELYGTPLPGVAAQSMDALSGDRPVAPLEGCVQIARRASFLFAYDVRGPPVAV